MSETDRTYGPAALAGAGASEGTGGVSRRRFLTGIAGTACSVALLGMGLTLYSRSASTTAPNAIRPPGALDEDGFLASCVRCGLCVRDCPYDTLKLAQLGEAVAASGTPYFIAREIPCEMCDPIYCVLACPTGALDPALTDIDEARMGLAVVVDQETCLAFQGMRCEVCFHVCPVKGDAITLEQRHDRRTGVTSSFVPVVHSDACTGCGKCEHACITEEAAIKVMPTHLAKGHLGEHYRFGWIEQQRAGGEMLAPYDKEHEFHLPEGVRYEWFGEGLIIDDPGVPAEPPPADPIDTLNEGLEGFDGGTR